MRNCPNCGAVLEAGRYNCAYCGTLYLDLSMIDFDKSEPFFLTIKKNNITITQKVKPETAEFTSEADTVYAYGRHGQRISSFVREQRLNTNINFIAIPFKNDNQQVMAIMRKEG